MREKGEAEKQWEERVLLKISCENRGIFIGLLVWFIVMIVTVDMGLVKEGHWRPEDTSELTNTIFAFKPGLKLLVLPILDAFHNLPFWCKVLPLFCFITGWAGGWIAFKIIDKRRYGHRIRQGNWTDRV